MKKKFVDIEIGEYFSEENPRVREVFQKVTDREAASLIDNVIYGFTDDSFEWLIVEEPK